MDPGHQGPGNEQTRRPDGHDAHRWHRRAELLGYVLTVLVYEPPQWLPWFMIPAVFAVLVVAVFVVIWESLDVMD